MGPAPAEPSGLPPKQRKVKAYQVLGDVNEFQERLASTLPPPKPPPPPNVFTIQDTSEFPPEVWFAATISPDNGVAVIASFRELSKARALYQQQLTHIHTARRQYGATSATGGATGPLAPLGTLGGGFSGPGGGPAADPYPLNRTVAETLRLGAETRRLGKFELQQAKWDEVTATLAGKVGRAPQDLAMQRGPAWRTRAELTELLYRAQPRDARGLNPDEAWLTSLRDAWERVIPLGSIFTGLSLHIKEKPHELPDTRAARVGRPLDPLGLGTGPTPLASLTQPPGALQLQQQLTSAGNGASGGAAVGQLSRPVLGRSLSARGRSWEDSELLRQRVAEYGSRLRSLAPHDPDFGSLVVAGEALEGQLAALATAPISLAEVEAHMRGGDPAAYEAYKAVKDEMEAQFRAALEAEEAQRVAAVAAAAAAAPQPGPRVNSSVSHLSLCCHTGETTHGSLTLACCGTSAVWWRWERRLDPQPAHSAVEVGRPQRFIASQQSGTLLPGQSLELFVTFVASAAGTFRETWELVTTPPLQGPGGPTLLVHLRGSAELRDQTATGRAALASSLEQREKLSKVAAAVERVLRDVKAPRRPQPAEQPEEAAAADEWDRVNGGGVEGGAYAWPPLFHSPAIQSELSEVYREANAALTVALTPPPEEDNKKTRKGTADRHRRKPVEEPPPPPPRYPPGWPGSNLATLDALLAELTAAAPAVAAPLVARADAAKARARVPPSGRKLLRRAMRSLVVKMVEGVEERLGAIRADLEAKAAAEAAAAAAAAAAAEEGGGEGHEGLGGGEASGTSVGAMSTATAATGHGKAAAAKDKKEKEKKDKAGAGKKGGAHGHGASGDGAGAAAAAAAAAAGQIDLQSPAFHDKALVGAKAVVKASLNSLLDEVHRHKLAVGDALEANIRTIDTAIAEEQGRLLQAKQAQAQSQGDAEEAAAGEGGSSSGGAAAAGAVVDWYAPPAGGVPAPSPGQPAAVRSGALEQLYWDRLCVLRTWTALGIPNRGDIR